MNNTPQRPGALGRVAKLLGLVLGLSAIAGQGLAAENTGPVASTFPSPLGRFLLVAGEGLYVVEPDGTPSWSYHPAPPGQPGYDDIIYDGWPLPDGHYLFSTTRYVREIDRDQRTLWEYRVKAPTEVKCGVPLPNGNVAALNSQEQAILELEAGTGRVLRRTPLPAQGDDHTRYMLMRRTPEGNYLVALRAEERFVEVTPEGKVVHSFSTPAGEVVHKFKLPCMPVMAQRLADGTTLGTGFFGLVRLDADWKLSWWFTHADAAPHFPLLFTWGVTELPDHRLVVANSDWHSPQAGVNRVQLFAVDAEKRISWVLPATAYQPWKRSEVEPATGFTEHRTNIVQLLGPAVDAK